MLAWCAVRLTSLFPASRCVCAVSEHEIALARTCLDGTGWEAIGTTRAEDLDAWLDVVLRLNASSFIAAYPEAALCPATACLQLSTAFASGLAGLAHLVTLPAGVAPEIVRVDAAATLRRIIPDEHIGSRFLKLFDLAERAGLRDIDGVPCTNVSADGSGPPPVPASITFEALADIECLRAAASEPDDLLRGWMREQRRWLRQERARTVGVVAPPFPHTESPASRRSVDRVLFVSNPSAFSGAESSTVALAEALVRQGVATAALVAYRGELTRRLEAAGCEVFCEDRAFLAASIDAWRLIAEVVDTWKPDVMHYCGRSGLLPLQVAASRRLPAVYLGHVPIPAVYSDAAGWADRFVAVSDSVAQAMRDAGLDDELITIIGNGLNPAPYELAAAGRSAARESLRIAPGAFVVLTLGRFSPEKRLSDAVAAMAHARTRVPGIKLLMAGDTQSGQTTLHDLLHQIHQAGLHDVVRVMGQVTDVTPLLAAADALVLCSESEGLPMAALEAMATGIPLVATRVGGLANLAGGDEDQDRCGLAVPIGAPSALAEALVRLFDDAALRLRLGGRGRALIRDQYAIETTAGRLMDVYRTARSNSQ